MKKYEQITYVTEEQGIKCIKKASKDGGQNG